MVLHCYMNLHLLEIHRLKLKHNLLVSINLMANLPLN